MMDVKEAAKGKSHETRRKDSMAKKNARNYGERIFAQNETITNDTRLSGLNNNDLIIGKSGGGKTGGYVIPNIQRIDGSLIVTDTKGQLARRFSKELENKGYRVSTIDFVDPLRSCGYNPMSFIRRYEDGSYREQDVLSLAKLICPPMSRKDDPIWDHCANLYVAFLIAYCLEIEDPEDQNLITVAELHRNFSSPRGHLPFADWAEENPDSFAAKKYKELEANRVAEKMWASIVGFVNADLEPFDFKEARNIFAAEESFDLSRIGREKTVLFINILDTDRSIDALVNIVYAQALQVLCAQADANPDGRLDIPVRIIMDDFAAGACLPDFDKTISIIRSRDISVSVILQSISQLDTMYEHAASLTILNNCDTILYMGSQDKDTADYVAYRAMKTPEAIFTMPRDMVYLIRSGERARLVPKIVPYSTVDDYEAPDEQAGA